MTTTGSGSVASVLEAGKDDLDYSDLLYLLEPLETYPTPAEIVDAGYLGAWEDIEGLGDSVEFVQKLRKGIWDTPRD